MLATRLLELVAPPLDVGELLREEPPGDLAGLAEAPDALAGCVEWGDVDAVSHNVAQENHHAQDHDEFKTEQGSLPGVMPTYG